MSRSEFVFDYHGYIRDAVVPTQRPKMLHESNITCRPVCDFKEATLLANIFGPYGTASEILHQRSHCPCEIFKNGYHWSNPTPQIWSRHDEQLVLILHIQVFQEVLR